MQDVIELLDFEAKVVLLLEALQDGIDAGDIDEAWNAAQAALPAIQGIKNVPSQWENATDEEKDAAIQGFKDTLDLQNDTIEQLVEEIVKGQGTVANILILVKKLRSE